MNKKIIAFGASSSIQSINKQLASFAAHQLQEVDVILLDLNDFEMPIYSIDKENATGIPNLAHQFKQHLIDADGLIISFAEHNGAYSTAFKNIFDWISRIDSNVWNNNPMLLMATSPGSRGGQTVLDIAVNKLSRMTESQVVSFSLPSFMKNFSTENGIIDDSLKNQFEEILGQFSNLIKSEEHAI